MHTPKKNTLMKLRKRDRQTRQRLIIDAARKVFGQKTYDTVSMAEIAKTAGISKSSIYTYFQSQEALYAEIACRDAAEFLRVVKHRIETSDTDSVKTAVECFIDYYVVREDQWRMVTRLALQGTPQMASVERLNQAGRQIMNLFESVLIKSGCAGDTRLISHAIFSSLCGILIAFRNYPGRTEHERIKHMKRIGNLTRSMIQAYIKETNQS